MASRVTPASDGKEGVDIFNSRPADFVAVIVDMTMPKLGGEDVFRELKRTRADIPIILTSGYNEQDATNRFAGKGLAGFIQKPFRLEALTALVRQVLEK